jgi:uncharacterized protein YukE
MAHKVASVQSLYEDSVSLYNNVVEGDNDHSASRVIRDLQDGIANLKENWGGKDAGAQINNIIGVNNAMVGVRNALAVLARESSKVASNYRDIQNSNGAGLESFTALNCEDKTVMEEYSDDRDSIDIKTEVSGGLAKIQAAQSELESFIAETKKAFGNIMDNWTEGDDNRTQAKDAIETFFRNADTYKETLAQAAKSADTAIQNYRM